MEHKGRVACLLISRSQVGPSLRCLDLLVLKHRLVCLCVHGQEERNDQHFALHEARKLRRTFVLAEQLEPLTADPRPAEGRIVEPAEPDLFR